MGHHATVAEYSLIQLSDTGSSSVTGHLSSSGDQGRAGQGQVRFRVNIKDFYEEKTLGHFFK